MAQRWLTRGKDDRGSSRLPAHSVACAEPRLPMAVPGKPSDGLSYSHAGGSPVFNRQTRAPLFAGGGRRPVTMTPITANIAPPTHTVPLDPGLRGGGMHKKADDTPDPRGATGITRKRTDEPDKPVALPRRRPGPSCDDARNSGHQPANTRSATGPRPLPGRNAQKSGRHAQSIEKRRASRANARTNQPARFSSADAASLISAAIISAIGSSLVTMPTDCPAMTEPCSISPSITARRSAPAQ